MTKLYIKGLVRVADTVRRSLAVPLSAERKAQLQQLATDSLTQVDKLLAKHGAGKNDLPAPTRRAYEFLSGLDFDRIAIATRDSASVRPAGSVTMTGLMSFWEGVLHRLASSLQNGDLDQIHRNVATATENIRRHLADHQLRLNDLKAPSRNALTWLRFFAVRVNLDAYVAAARIARPILHASMRNARTRQGLVHVEFRPMSGLYRMRAHRNITRIVLPTPMISFSAARFRMLAETIFGNGAKQPLIEATQDEAYQAIQAELSALGGEPGRTAGIRHDLAAAFDRVVSKYFPGNMDRPRLTWNQTLTSRKFGHYDWLTDTVMISCTLDHPDVAEFVVDYVLYHELLHKKLGVRWRNGRQAAHTPEFRAEERRFEQYVAAERILKKLAG